MPSLADLQSQLRSAVVAGDGTIAAHLVGGRDPAARLAIHRRHYESSLVNALLVRFPAVAWLIGTPLLSEAARDFVRRHPPTAPCIAEYGMRFPNFLATRADDDSMPYLQSFARLEWHLGEVAIAIDLRPVSIDALAGIITERLPDVCLGPQPGLRYLDTAWPVDDLMKLYLLLTKSSIGILVLLML